MIDKRPLLIARCADVADVIAAVNFGRDNKLPIAIRGGGHNGPGLASVSIAEGAAASGLFVYRVEPVIQDRVDVVGKRLSSPGDRCRRRAGEDQIPSARPNCRVSAHLNDRLLRRHFGVDMADRGDDDCGQRSVEGARRTPTLVGIDHGCSFPLWYFEVHRLEPNWVAFLDIPGNRPGLSGLYGGGRSRAKPVSATALA